VEKKRPRLPITASKKFSCIVDMYQWRSSDAFVGPGPSEGGKVCIAVRREDRGESLRRDDRGDASKGAAEESSTARWRCGREQSGVAANLFFRVFLLRGPIRKSGSWRSAAIVKRKIRVFF
jgi:hypothetical protein